MSATVISAARLVDALRLDAAETDREGGFPSGSIAMLHEAGLLVAPVRESLGGVGLGQASSTRELLEVLVHIGRGNLVVGRLYEGHVNALQMVERFGTDEQRERWSHDAAAGRLFGVWNTEAGDGVKLLPIGTSLELRGSKTFASGCGHVARALVTAASDRGWQMLVVDTERRAPREDRSFWKPLGMRATASFKADFSGMPVASADLLGAPGDYYRQPAFGGGAIRFAAVQQGGAEAIFDETRRFLAGMGRVDDPYQRMRLGEMALAVESGRLWLDGAARHVSAAMAADDRTAADSRSLSIDRESHVADDGADSTARAVAYANLVRSAIEENCLRVMKLAERSVGARGLLKPEPFERLHRDLTHYLRQPAPDAAIADVGAFVLARGDAAHTLWR